ncbi:hypothetical protein AURDEDRAFT_165556 [Auricularia subglabra TFB-10046 SS5]|nr:hypothetical protein AURDEDRAFT_165556 [Auricularia subglabra TFB-10046 SS5]
MLRNYRKERPDLLIVTFILGIIFVSALIVTSGASISRLRRVPPTVDEDPASVIVKIVLWCALGGLACVLTNCYYGPLAISPVAHLVYAAVVLWRTAVLLVRFIPYRNAIMKAVGCRLLSTWRCNRVPAYVWGTATLSFAFLLFFSAVVLTILTFFAMWDDNRRPGPPEGVELDVLPTGRTSQNEASDSDGPTGNRTCRWDDVRVEEHPPAYVAEHPTTRRNGREKSESPYTFDLP